MTGEIMLSLELTTQCHRPSLPPLYSQERCPAGSEFVIFILELINSKLPISCYLLISELKAHVYILQENPSQVGILHVFERETFTLHWTWIRTTDEKDF